MFKANKVDIYRHCVIHKDTMEHVIQSGLGVDIKIPGCIDHQTNVDFGSTIDKKLLEDYAVFRAFAGLKTRRGDDITVRTEGGEYDIKGIKPILKKKPSPPWNVTVNSEGKPVVCISAENYERGKQLVHHFLQKSALLGVPAPDKALVREEKKYVDGLEIKGGLGGTVHFRAIAKSCFNAFAYYLGPLEINKIDCSAIRNYILGGVDHYSQLCVEKNAISRELSCFESRSELLLHPESPIEDSLEHRLILCGVQSTGIVYATFEMFEHIPYSVLLCDCWLGDDFCWGIRANPCENGKQYTIGDYPIELRPPLTSESVLSHELSLFNLQQRIQHTFRALQIKTRNRYHEDSVSAAIDDLFNAHEGELFSPELAGSLANRLAEDFVNHLYRLDSSITLPSLILNEEDVLPSTD